MLRLSLAMAELTAEAGARVDLPVEVEARRVRATLRVEGLPEGFAPPPMALEEGRRTLTLPLLAKEVRKAYEKLLELSWQARYEPLTREEGRELWREALEAYEALREALGGTGGLPGEPGA